MIKTIILSKKSKNIPLIFVLELLLLSFIGFSFWILRILEKFENLKIDNPKNNLLSHIYIL